MKSTDNVHSSTGINSKGLTKKVKKPQYTFYWDWVNNLGNLIAIFEHGKLADRKTTRKVCSMEGLIIDDIKETNCYLIFKLKTI